MALLKRSWSKVGFAACGLLALSLSACQGGGHFSVLGYTTRPNYDECIKTVYVPIFQNSTFYRDLEFDLTRAVIREIEAKTPYKVVSNRAAADTELCGTIVGVTKRILNRNQLNEVREAETILAAQVTWRDLKTGEVLSMARRNPGMEMMPPIMLSPDGVPLPVPDPAMKGDADLPHPTPLEPDGPLARRVVHGPKPTLVTSEATFIPELGESLTTAKQRNVDRLAVQIVSMMEKPW